MEPTEVTVLGIVILLRRVQSLNALNPMVVTPECIVTFLRFLQLLKAEYSMFFTVLGMVTVCMYLLLEKAEDPMVVTVEGIVTVADLPVYETRTPLTILNDELFAWTLIGIIENSRVISITNTRCFRACKRFIFFTPLIIVFYFILGFAYKNKVSILAICVKSTLTELFYQ